MHSLRHTFRTRSTDKQLLFSFPFPPPLFCSRIVDVRSGDMTFCQSRSNESRSVFPFRVSSFFLSILYLCLCSVSISLPIRVRDDKPRYASCPLACCCRRCFHGSTALARKTTVISWERGDIVAFIDVDADMPARYGAARRGIRARRTQNTLSALYYDANANRARYFLTFLLINSRDARGDTRTFAVGTRR